MGRGTQEGKKRTLVMTVCPPWLRTKSATRDDAALSSELPPVRPTGRPGKSAFARKRLQNRIQMARTDEMRNLAMRLGPPLRLPIPDRPFTRRPVVVRLMRMRASEVVPVRPSVDAVRAGGGGSLGFRGVRHLVPSEDES